ncbi:MAG: Rpn family recombination-promoting nuclease/putative transposase, partial [Candidatus Competibacter sp.]
MKTDSLFYRLFQYAPMLVFELAGLEAPAAGTYQFRAEEIKQTAFRLDGVLIPSPAQADAPVVFVEVQAQPDPEFYGRFFAELLLYLYRNQPPHPWRAVVIYPTRAEERLNARHYGSLVGLSEVQRVYLEDFRDRPVTGAGVGLIQLIVSEPEDSLTQATQLLQRARTASWADWPSAQVADFVETILVYKLPQLNREEIQAMLGLIDTDLKQTRFYQEVFAEG